jgi:hypothetical protein
MRSPCSAPANRFSDTSWRSKRSAIHACAALVQLLVVMPFAAAQRRFSPLASTPSVEGRCPSSRVCRAWHLGGIAPENTLRGWRAASTGVRAAPRCVPRCSEGLLTATPSDKTSPFYVTPVTLAWYKPTWIQPGWRRMPSAALSGPGCPRARSRSSAAMVGGRGRLACVPDTDPVPMDP